MRGMRFRTVLAVTAATAALGTVSACGGGTSTPAAAQQTSAAPSPVAVSPVAYLLQVEDATAKVHSAAVDETDTSGTLRQQRLVGDGDWSNGLQGNFTMSEKSSAPTQTPPLQMKFRSDAMYVKAPAQKAAGLGGKHWIKEPLALLAEQGAGGKATVDQLKQANPAMSVRMLLATGDLRKVGEETVRGTAATHYAGTLDTAKLIAAKQGLTPDDVKFIKEQLAAKGAVDQHIDLWINSENLPVEEQEQTQTNTAKITSTTYYSNYGVAVDLSVPDASDTYTLHSLAGANPSSGA